MCVWLLPPHRQQQESKSLEPIRCQTTNTPEEEEEDPPALFLQRRSLSILFSLSPGSESQGTFSPRLASILPLLFFSIGSSSSFLCHTQKRKLVIARGVKRRRRSESGRKKVN